MNGVELKRRWLQSALVVLTFWPLAQLALVFTLDVSPWKLAGWGMYAAPVKVPYLALAGGVPGQPRPTPIDPPHPSLARPIERYMTTRIDLGPSVSGEGLARKAFAVYPQFERIYFHFIEVRLDRSTDRLVRRPFVYAFERTPQGGARELEVR